MGKRMQVRRLFWLAVLVGAAFAGLGYRLVDLQVLRHDSLTEQAQKNTQNEVLMEPRRGDVRDIKGTVLATSILVKTICADPSMMAGNQPYFARGLAPLIEESEASILQKLQPRLRRRQDGNVVTNQFVILKRRLPIETWEKVQAALKIMPLGDEGKQLSKQEAEFQRQLRSKAVFARDEQIRTYPNGKLAAHIIGYATPEDREVIDKPVSEIIGREGIELSYNAKLKGILGWRVTENDGRKREVVSLRDQDVEARDGNHVVLTIDAVIQNIVETHLAEAVAKHNPISATAVVTRPRTGEILAMATLPNFDPNLPGAASADYRRNRIITDTLEPGSTFKIVAVSGALNDKITTPTEVFNCERGIFRYGGHVLHDHESYGSLTTEGIITKSSNIGAAKIGIKMGENRLYEHIKNYGFGAATGIELPGEVRGWVHPVKNWSKVSIAQIPMGHGLTVTRLQMALAMGAIANNGVLMRPMLVDRLEDSQGRVVAEYSPQRLRQVISESAARQMVKALKTVVGPDGTAPKAALEHYAVAGKTGTATKVENGVYVKKYFASFIGFFPADNPELCIAVVLDEPRNGYYGGQTAAPVFKQIAERIATYLNLRPDNGLETLGAALASRDSRTNAIAGQ